jgi:hypothetical protein
MNEKIQTLIQRTKELTAERDRLLDKLSRSLAIKAFMPDAFEHGPCHTSVAGNLFRPREMRMTFHLASGEDREFSITDVPQELWPDFVKESYQRLKK